MRRFLLGIAAVLLTATMAAADGDGPDRKMTSQESAACGAVQKTLREALPDTPEGYRASLTGFEGPCTLPEAITPDRMHRMFFEVKYTLTDEALQKHAVAGIVNRTKGSPRQQERLAALRGKSEELKKARGNARDRAEKDRIRAEIKAVNEEENRLVDEIAAGIQTPMDPMKELPAKELSVRFQVNQEVRVRDQATPYSVPGFPMAFEQKEGCVDFGTYCITVLLGPFEKGNSVVGATVYPLRNVPLGVPTKPRGLALVVSGPKDKPEVVRELLKRTDIKKLAAMLP